MTRRQKRKIAIVAVLLVLLALLAAYYLYYQSTKQARVRHRAHGCGCRRTAAVPLLVQWGSERSTYAASHRRARGRRRCVRGRLGAPHDRRVQSRRRLPAQLRCVRDRRSALHRQEPAQRLPLRLRSPGPHDPHLQSRGRVRGAVRPQASQRRAAGFRDRRRPVGAGRCDVRSRRHDVRHGDPQRTPARHLQA